MQLRQRLDYANNPKQKPMRFHPEKSLFDLPAVRQTFILFFTISALMTIAIAVKSDLYFRLDYVGFNSAIEIFKVPLGTLAVGLTIIGIFGANHRSEQTKRQIERTATQIQLTQSQNNFSNYYKHLEEFSKFCDLHKDGPNFVVARPRRLHILIFPKSTDGIYTISEDFLESLDRDVNRLFELVDMLADTTSRVYTISLIGDHIWNMTDKFGLTTKSVQGRQITNGTQTMFMAGTTLQEYVDYQFRIFKFINEILKFDAHYTPSAALNQLFGFPLAKISSSTYVETTDFWAA